MTEPSPNRLRRRLVRGLWATALVLLAAVVLRLFVADVYPVASSSMEPTLFPGDQVLVWFDRSVPARGELVVVRGEDGMPLVKRVAGLPGEEVVLTPEGDLRIGRELLGEGDGHPPWVPVFDSARLPLLEHFTSGDDPAPWTEPEPGVLRLDPEAAPGGVGMLGLHKGVHDDHLTADGVVYGAHPAGDLALELDWRVERLAGTAVFVLTERGDTFELRLELGEEDASPAPEPRLRLLRHRDTGHGDDSVPAHEVLADLPLAVEPGRWNPLRLENRDNLLRVDLDGERVVTVPYPRNCPGPGPDGDSLGERVRLGAEGVALEVRDVRVERDLHYTPRGAYGVKNRVRLGQDELFVLGDNSAASRDSRDFGPVPVARILGRPVAVVWPLDRRRWLR